MMPCIGGARGTSARPARRGSQRRRPGHVRAVAVQQLAVGPDPAQRLLGLRVAGRPRRGVGGALVPAHGARVVRSVRRCGPASQAPSKLAVGGLGLPARSRSVTRDRAGRRRRRSAGQGDAAPGGQRGVRCEGSFQARSCGGRVHYRRRRRSPLAPAGRIGCHRNSCTAAKTRLRSDPCPRSWPPPSPIPTAAICARIIVRGRCGTATRASTSNTPGLQKTRIDRCGFFYGRSNACVESRVLPHHQELFPCVRSSVFSACSPATTCCALRRHALDAVAAPAPSRPGLVRRVRRAARLLVHERLAIVDPAGGAQPLLSEDGRLALAVNGEIYNHRELKAELAQPYAFQTGSDCEVINALYLEHGPAACREAQRHLRLRAVGRDEQRGADRARSARRVPAVLGPRRATAACGGLGNEGAGAALRRRGAVPAGPCLRQRHRRTARSSTSAPWREYDAVRRRQDRVAAGAARRLRAGRAPPADDRRALRRAAVRRPGFLAGRRLRGAFRAPARRGRTTQPKPGGRACTASRSA